MTDSNLIQQFIAAAAKAPVIERDPYRYTHFCEACQQDTKHKIQDVGDWEIYICKCGHEHAVRVR